MTNKCYYCGLPATNIEHIPAKSLLNGYSGLNLLTVPSCNEHNNSKSSLDELIGLLLIKPTVKGYKLFTPNKKKNELRNLVTEIRIRSIYRHNLFYSNRFRYKDGIVEVTSPDMLREILKYFELVLAGCYYDFTKLMQQLPMTYNCVSLSIFHFLDYPPNILSRSQDKLDYSIISNIKKNTYLIENKKQNVKFEYEIRRVTPSCNLNIATSDGRNIIINHDDLIIVATIHQNIVVFGVFSKQNRNFESFNITNVIESFEPNIFLPVKHMNHDHLQYSLNKTRNF